MRLADLKIDPDFKNLLPELDAETYTALEKDIVSNGVLDPIITWNGFIVDGHNRYEICKAHHVEEIQTKSLNKATKSDVMQWIVNHQFAKRNLTKSEQIILLSKVEAQIAKEAKERQLSTLKQNTVESNLTQRIEEEKGTGRTAEIMAKKMGVSKNTYKDMKTVVEKGTPEQIKRMDEGGKGNGVSSIAKEIKDGTDKNTRKCATCKRILPLSEFPDSTHRFRCRDCRDESKRKSCEKPLVMPDTLNPDIPIVIKASVIVEEFKNVFLNMERSLRFSIEANGEHFDDAIKESIVQMIDEHINHMNAIRGEMKDAPEG